MNPIPKINIETAIFPDFIDEFILLIDEEINNPHFQFFLSELLENKLNIKKLFDYGIDKLKKLEKRPDFELATYFLLLSSLNGIPQSVYSYAIDIMVYAENDDDYVATSEKYKLIEEYTINRSQLL